MLLLDDPGNELLLYVGLGAVAFNPAGCGGNQQTGWKGVFHVVAPSGKMPSGAITREEIETHMVNSVSVNGVKDAMQSC